MGVPWRRGIPFLVLAGFILSCSSDHPSRPDTGLLRVRAVFESAVPLRKLRAALPVPDSLCVVVGRPQDGPVQTLTTGVPDSGDVVLDFTLPPAEGYEILLQAEGPGEPERGAILFGREDGIGIEAGHTTEETVILARAVPSAPAIVGEAGDLTYTVRWEQIDGAAGYVLRERSGVTLRDYALSDTQRVFTPGIERGSARLDKSGKSLRAGSRSGRPGGSRTVPATRRSYRVRADLPLGPGIFGDSSWVDLDLWYDLPRVVDVDPADGAVGVPDAARIRVWFDREMDPASLGETGVILSVRDTETPVPCARTVEEGSTVAILTPVTPLVRGTWYRIAVSTEAEDPFGRPLDQDPEDEGLQGFHSDFQAEPYDPIRVIEVIPADGQGSVATDAVVLVRFNKEVDRSSVASSGFTVSDSAGAISGSRQVIEGGFAIEYRANRSFLYDLEHTVRLETTLLDEERHEPLDQDPAAGGFQPFLSSFRTIPQSRGPRVVWSVPIPGEPHHPVYLKPEIVFDRPIDPATAVLGRGILLQILLFGNPFNIPGALQLSADSLRVTIVPGLALERDKFYRIGAVGGTGGIRDRAGVPLDQDFYTPGFQSYEASFRAEQNVRVVSVSPAASAQNVPWNAVVQVAFSMPVQPESVVDTTFALLRDGARVAASLAVSGDSLTATLTPAEPLAGYQTYQVQVTTAVRSRRGGPFDQDFNAPQHQGLTSTFRTLPETVAPMVVSVDPSDGTREVPIEAVVRVVFSEPVRPTKAIDYTYVTRGDSLGARVPGTVTVSSDSLSATFIPQDTLAYATRHHVHVDTWVTDPFGNRLDQDPDLPGWQKFHSVFTTASERERPLVVAIVPQNGAAGVLVTGPVRLDFSESIDRGSIPGGVRIETGGNPVGGMISFENADRTVTWTPSTALHYSRLYRVAVDSLVVDLAGNRLDQEPGTPNLDPFESFFTTEVDTVSPSIVAVDPPDEATGISIDVAPRITFTEPIDPASVNAASIALNDSAGGSVPSVQNVSANGATVTITPDAPLAFDTLYRILVATTLTDTSGVPFDGQPDVDGYQPYGSSFRTGEETIPPRVLAMLLDGGPPAPVDTRVRIVFSEPIDRSTVDATTFHLRLGDLNVPAARTVSATGDTATLVPDQWLAYESTYEVGVAGVADPVGNLLDQDPVTEGSQPYENSFVTGIDLDPPWVARSEPEAGASGVEPDATLRLAFSEPMDTLTFSVADPGLYLDEYPVPAVRTAEPGDTAFVIVPESPLERGNVYEWRAGTLLADRHGNGLDQDPATAGSQPFQAFFDVGSRPIPDVGPGLCSVGGTAEVSFDASGSTDPDGEIVRAIWEWGDGTVDSLDAPGGLQAIHAYACTDDAGCDGVDNDSDGSIDEEGDDGCDESYRIALTLVDDDGFESRDTTGVSFCAFRVISSDPTNEATEVDTLVTPSLFLSRPVDPATLDSTSVWLALEGDVEVRVLDSLSVEGDGRTIVIHPRASLLPDTAYVVHAGGSLGSADGDPLDQQPCEAGMQEFLARFRTLLRPEPGPPRFRQPVEIGPPRTQVPGER